MSAVTQQRGCVIPAGTTVLFVGPSLRGGDLDGLDNSVSVRPPIRRGDLPAAITAGARRIAIVDGEFYQSLAVSAKEILAALDAGLEISGAASMGALRAAELDRYGMTGIGQVYQWFAGGQVHRDDDVAVSYAHDEGDYRLLTVPMVCVRWVVTQARLEGWLPAEACRRLSAAARRIYWEERSWSRVIATAGLAAEHAAAVRRYVADPDHDIKRLDALAAVRSLIGAT